MEKTIVSVEPLTMRPLTPKELLEIFVFSVEKDGGSCPSHIPTLQEGLTAASEKLALFKIFIGNDGEMLLSKEIKSAFDNKSFEGRKGEDWSKIHISDWAKGKISIRMETIPTPEGQLAFKEAAAAANKVWAEQAI